MPVPALRGRAQALPQRHGTWAWKCTPEAGDSLGSQCSAPCPALTIMACAWICLPHFGAGTRCGLLSSANGRTLGWCMYLLQGLCSCYSFRFSVSSHLLPALPSRAPWPSRSPESPAPGEPSPFMVTLEVGCVSPALSSERPKLSQYSHLSQEASPLAEAW